jgi:hypothetical protein
MAKTEVIALSVATNREINKHGFSSLSCANEWKSVKPQRDYCMSYGETMGETTQRAHAHTHLDQHTVPDRVFYLGL